LIDLLTISFSL